MMNKTLSLTVGTLLLAFSTVQAALDIVQKNGAGTIYLLKNTDTGMVLGTFWDRQNEKSDYGFESSIVPDFVWSADRSYVAVTAGASRSRAVSLYRVTENSLKPIEVPQLSADQAAEIDAIDDVSASGTDAVRWTPNGELLLRFWAAPRVTSDTEESKDVSVWADVEVTGDKARIVGTSTMEPSTPPAEMFPNPAPPAGETLASQEAEAAAEDEGFSPERLVGVHPVSGTNPDGSSYQGTAEIRVVNGVVGIEWKIGKTVSHGQGLLVGQTLGVALDDGLAIYQLFGQAEGQSLIGIWSSAGSSKTNHEAILIGNADMTQATIDPVPINGKYRSLREFAHVQVESLVTISGGDQAKTVRWTDSEGQTTKRQGLALGDGFAVLTPVGLSVCFKGSDASASESLVGMALLKDGTSDSESLHPIP